MSGDPNHMRMGGYVGDPFYRPSHDNYCPCCGRPNYHRPYYPYENQPICGGNTTDGIIPTVFSKDRLPQLTNEQLETLEKFKIEMAKQNLENQKKVDTNATPPHNPDPQQS